MRESAAPTRGTTLSTLLFRLERDSEPAADSRSDTERGVLAAVRVLHLARQVEVEGRTETDEEVRRRVEQNRREHGDGHLLRCCCAASTGRARDRNLRLRVLEPELGPERDVVGQ